MDWSFEPPPTLWGFPSVQHSPLWYSALGTWDPLTLLDSQPYLLSSGRRMVSPWVPSLLCGLETLQWARVLLRLASCVSSLSGVPVLCSLLNTVWKWLLYIFHSDLKLFQVRGSVWALLLYLAQAGFHIQNSLRQRKPSSVIIFSCLASPCFT